MDFLGPYALGPNDTEWQGIYTGDARVLAKHIPDESVDLIFTDPVYERTEDYRWLAETAKRILKPNSAALVYTGPGQLFAATQAMVEGGLDYRWTAVLHWAGTNGWGSIGFQKWAAMIVMQKGKAPRHTLMFDVKTHAPGSSKLPDPSSHKWQKPPDILAYYLEGFSRENNVIFDPFSGGGSLPRVCKMLGRHFIGFEVDQQTAVESRGRLVTTQPPLFVLDAPKQLAFDAA